MNLLALDTSTDLCTVALWMDGRVLERQDPAGQQSERLLTLVDSLLDEAGFTLRQLDAIAFGRGPGSFTGLRIGAGVAQGLAFGAGLPVVPVSSLAALAQSVDAPRVLAAFDARMQQVYWGAYQRDPQGVMVLQGSELVISPASVPLPEGGNWVGAGPGWDAYHVDLTARLGPHVKTWHPRMPVRAGQVAVLGAMAMKANQAVAPEAALPVYIRDDVAVKSQKS